MKTELTKRFEKLAFAQTIPFCYGCYQKAPSGRCKHCGSDDLMRSLDGVGCEYGTDWVIQYLLDSSVESIDIDLAFENSISECYCDRVRVGWINVDVCEAIKQLDPISWELAKSEWIDFEEGEENLISFDNGGTYYWVRDIESFLDESAEEIDSEST